MRFTENSADIVNPVLAEQKSLKRAVTVLDLRFLDLVIFLFVKLWITEQPTIFDQNELVKIMSSSEIIKISFVRLIIIFLI